jgi:DNA modification methylase
MKKKAKKKKMPSGAAKAQSDYSAFLKTKTRDFTGKGVEVFDYAIHESLYPFQNRLVRWALRKGRAAIWADTGLGKSRMQLEWARHIPGRKLILAPLCVAQQTIAEAATIGLEVGALDSGLPIVITNYEQLHKVRVADFSGVVLDESSILKSFEGKTRTELIDRFDATPYKLCCTATPAPNDISELANHCEFLGVMSRTEMLATFFVHDDEGWRLKKHAPDSFYRWLASWGMFVRRPSDLGFADDGYILPALNIQEHVVACEVKEMGSGIVGRMKARHASLEDRCAKALELLDDKNQWIAWCGLNTEQDLMARELGKDAVSISGADSPEVKEQRIKQFLSGAARVLVSKTAIVGFGLNFQNCSREVFVGIGDSFEQYYQAIRRCWRFGQKNPVDVHIVVSESEIGIVENVKRKEAEHEKTSAALVAQMRDAELEEIGATQREVEQVKREQVTGKMFTMYNADCIDVLGELKENSVDLSVYSPPFSSLFVYSNSHRDLGNCTTKAQFLEHFGYAVRGILKATKPGRLTCCHIAQVASTLVTNGVIGLIDLRGAVIECFVSNGWIFHGEAAIDKNPQAQAIRTHAKGLLFNQLHKDSSWSRPALADFVVIFRKPGENTAPVKPDITNDEWIKWAKPIWYDIRESNTLNVKAARAKEDERHICPLQLGLIERCIRLWSNKDETVLSPFAGIGSEGHEAVRLGRKFIGVELKKEYFNVAVRNLQDAERVQALF